MWSGGAIIASVVFGVMLERLYHAVMRWLIPDYASDGYWGEGE